MTKPRNLGALLALGALTALPACSMFGGGNGGSQYSQGSYARPANYATPSTYNTASNTMTTSTQTVAPVSRGMMRQVQSTLRQNGDYNGSIDGVWGPMTENGVRQWQQSHNLNANGEIDLATLQSMNIQPANQNGQANNGSYDNGTNGANQANSANEPMPPSADNGQTAPANGSPNYNTAGTHKTGNSYSNNNNDQPTTPYPTNQGSANNVPPGNPNNAANNGGTGNPNH